MRYIEVLNILFHPLSPLLALSPSLQHLTLQILPFIYSESEWTVQNLDSKLQEIFCFYKFNNLHILYLMLESFHSSCDLS